MIRAAALASGDGEKLQAVLDAMYFGELPDFELSAVICPEKNAYVMQRALNARIPAYVVDPDLFPTMTTHSMAVANKLKDMDIELVLLVDYDVPLGVIPYQFTASSAPGPPSAPPLRTARAICSPPCSRAAASLRGRPPFSPIPTGASERSSTSARSSSFRTTRPRRLRAA